MQLIQSHMPGKKNDIVIGNRANLYLVEYLIGTSN